MLVLIIFLALLFHNLLVLPTATTVAMYLELIYPYSSYQEGTVLTESFLRLK